MRLGSPARGSGDRTGPDLPLFYYRLGVGSNPFRQQVMRCSDIVPRRGRRLSSRSKAVGGIPMSDHSWTDHDGEVDDEGRGPATRSRKLSEKAPRCPGCDHGDLPGREGPQHRQFRKRFPEDSGTGRASVAGGAASNAAAGAGSPCALLTLGAAQNGRPVCEHLDVPAAAAVGTDRGHVEAQRSPRPRRVRPANGLPAT